MRLIGAIFVFPFFAAHCTAIANISDSFTPLSLSLSVAVEANPLLLAESDS
jgi:hypothetical protein